jgi:amino acid transporter
MRLATDAGDSSGADLGLGDAVSIILGIIIGTGIFVLPASVFSNVSGPAAGLGVWLLGGVLSLVGALCYAELATAYPSAGGDYGYLTRAYGSMVGYLFAWAQLAVIRSGAGIALMAYGFAGYATNLNLPGKETPWVYAVLAVVGPVLVNALGLRPGKTFQNLLTLTNVLGLLGIVVVGAFWSAPEAAQPAASSDEPSFALALVFVFLVYGGWNEAAYVAADLKNRRRTIVLALVLGLSAITFLYLAVNTAYLAALGFNGVRNSEAVAADVVALPLGERGKQLMSVLVMISALGAINGYLFTGMRLFGAFGSDHRLFSWLTQKSDKVSHGALAAQCAFSLGLILLVETAEYWHPRLHLEANENRITALVDCTAPVFWLFLLLTSVSLFVLRARDPGTERPFRVPGYPVLPLVFTGSCVFMLYRSTDYAAEKQPFEAIVVGGLLLLGLPLYALSGRGRVAERAPAEAKEIANHDAIADDFVGGPERPAAFESGGGRLGAG